MSYYLLAIDQGTTNSRAILFNHCGELQSHHALPLRQSFPQPGWVEQDPLEMVNNVINCCRKVIKENLIPLKKIAALGISNQRETTILWNRINGQPIYPAIVWQDRRTLELCHKISTMPISRDLQQKTGLLLDPYFSLTKIIWIFANVPIAHRLAERGELLFGTVDSYLLWQLSGGKVHATDATNAARTLMFNINTQTWDSDILQAFSIPVSILPQVLDNATYFGNIDASILGASIPIMGMAGDQQAAGIGQACFYPGMLKATYGSGGFLLLNIGQNFRQSRHRLLTTTYYRLNKQVTYGLEGSIFAAGTVIKWLRDNLHLLQTVAESATLASSVNSTEGVYFIPAFTGLGAPYWNAKVRATISGLTFNSGRAQIIRAALESIGYQTFALIEVMQSEQKLEFNKLRVNGAMTSNNWLMQFLADLLNLTVFQPQCIECTALGAAYLAGLGVGIYKSIEDISNLWQQRTVFKPQMSELMRKDLYRGWQAAVQRLTN